MKKWPELGLHFKLANKVNVLILKKKTHKRRKKVLNKTNTLKA